MIPFIWLCTKINILRIYKNFSIHCSYTVNHKIKVKREKSYVMAFFRTFNTYEARSTKGFLAFE